ncbi:unnamed protein product, partial [marine sediment metagenome]
MRKNKLRYITGASVRTGRYLPLMCIEKEFNKPQEDEINIIVGTNTAIKVT